MAAGKEVTPKDAENTEKLRQYWLVGNGSHVIRWGAPGDFSRCVVAVGRFMKDPEGYCANLHHRALGYWPATHAKMEREGT
ncbi:hypothetical protein SEA_NICHOLAS_95 [Mycobacterium phage Nicholas]|uniref:Uncharacterized protein n=1 Tax=Mycobacterium phage Lumos TaxID=1701852 RepID=A0A0K2CM57_9CAUD|nr:hypothetical protein AVU96_gp084 [Mycobacterium phage Snenia]YP_010012554.1 hypothetical protein J4T93_gp082 [Mycobacterium phage Lumos]ASM62832.1 hypothetical protein SEA_CLAUTASTROPHE_95 [Mycobacterium phage Clautastrophe]ASR87023.1 hypothetical protein SEA_KINGSOLOMON_95 [Mycobacterium phage Kingsolomon]ASR87366.1 hypothetical protein SEA_NICHOLAS_95 [Mycobacterium phage Nicholas]AYB70449.1 hypothetical protein SEA_SAMTY_96 [Mycobacterium phage Samty]QDF16679.1 hypothetical protein PBI_